MAGEGFCVEGLESSCWHRQHGRVTMSPLILSMDDKSSMVCLLGAPPSDAAIRHGWLAPEASIKIKVFVEAKDSGELKDFTGPKLSSNQLFLSLKLRRSRPRVLLSVKVGDM